MASHNYLSIIIILFNTIISSSSSQVSAQLSVSFYVNTCPSVFHTIRKATRAAVAADIRMGASLLRLHFHDCFVNGCDASVLLVDTPTVPGEQNVMGNAGSLRGYGVIDNIKAQVDRACGRSVVSCADILAVAARDSVVALGGPSYSVPVGRRDTRTVNQAGTKDLPAFFEDLPELTKKFSDKGFSAREMVALSGAHTLGQARCVSFASRIYNETNIDTAYATSLQANCPFNMGNGDNSLAPLDPKSPNKFGNSYFKELIRRRGLLHSDQVLFNGGLTGAFVRRYSNNAAFFSKEFGKAMVKMGKLSPLIGAQGEVRTDCKRIN